MNVHLLYEPKDDVFALLKDFVDPAVQVTAGKEILETAVPHILQLKHILDTVVIFIPDLNLDPIFRIINKHSV